MSKKLIALWVLIIILMFSTILVLGYGIKNNPKADDIDETIKNAAYNYAKDNDILPKINSTTVIFAEDLINNNYIPSEDIEDNCVKSISIFKGVTSSKIEIIKDCDNISE